MANLKTTDKKSTSQSMGMHTEYLLVELNKSFLIPQRLKTFSTLELTMLILIKEQNLMLKK